MKVSIRIVVALSFMVMAAGLRAQGADVIVGDLQEVANYSHDSMLGIDAFAVGTTSCNIGTQNLLWVSNTADHPVISQQAYRYLDGRFEQIGQSWLKHGFFALSNSLCSPCVNPTNGSTLGVGCSDPYGAGLNGSQSGLGPKYEVNPFTGAFVYPPASGTQGSQANSIFKRLQIHMSDLDPNLNPGAKYFVEGHYVTPDDAAAGNHFNNASYREVMFTGSTAVGYDMALAPSSMTHRKDPAIKAWPLLDPSVTLKAVDVPGEGRFWVGFKLSILPNGHYGWEVAIHNLNSHLAGGAFEVELPPGAVVSNIGFHDVDYHSGEPFAGTDWTATVTMNNTLLWQTDSFAVNPNANALRWGSLYNFRFETDLAPHVSQVPAIIHLFRPGAVNQVALTLDPVDSMGPVVGAAHGTNVSSMFPRQAAVRIISGGASPVVGKTVNFSVVSGSGSIVGPTSAITDANGVAGVNVMAGPIPGPLVIRADDGSNTADVDLYVREFKTYWNPTAGTLIFTTFTENVGMLLTTTWDVAPPVIYTPWGPLASTILNPGPNFGAVGATGLVGSYDPSFVTDANGNHLKVYFNMGYLNGLGLTVTFQSIGAYFDSLGFQYYLSNPVNVNF